MAEDRPADDAAPSPEAAVLAAEARRDLLAALERLGDDDRMVIGCRYLLELSEAETAATLGHSRAARSSRACPARSARMRAPMTGEEAR